MSSLNDIIDLYSEHQTEIENGKIEAYGFRMAPCLTQDITINRATEYIIKYDGQVLRVYNWEQSGGDSRMYIKTDGGYWRRFLTEEAVAMLTYGEPHYGELTYVAQGVKIAA